MIKIRVVSYNNEVPSEPLLAVFGPTGATIGRSNDNFLVLQDPKRYVSRLQASIKSDGARHTIVNLSQANPILVNGEEIAMGQEVELRYNDEIQIGLYLLKAESSAAETPAAAIGMETAAFVAPRVGDSRPASSGAATQSKKLASSLAPVDLDLSDFGGSGGDPFADLLGGQPNVAVASAPSIAHVAPIAAAPARQEQPPAPKTISTTAADPLGLDELLGSSAAPAVARKTTNDPVPAPASANDPFGLEDLLGSSNTAPSAIPSPASGARAVGNVDPFGFDDLLSGPSHTPLSPGHNAPIIPEDFDPFAMPSAAPRNNSDPLSGLPKTDVSLESIAGNRATIDGLISSTDAFGPSLLDPNALGPAHSSETDPLALFASESILPTAHSDKFLGDVASNHVSELKSHFTLPQARQEAIPPTTPEVVAPTEPAKTDIAKPATATEPKPEPKPIPPAANEQQAAPNQQALDGHALAAAFLRGANLPPDTIPSGVTLEWMEMMGRFVATATDGAVELIASRALVKREVKADLTMIVVRNNNPLKFLPDGQSALIQMLGRKIPGFMNPVEAMQDAYVDLRAHQIGVVAGMRAALDEVLRRFDPAMLEKKLKTRTLIDSLVAANRKAKMWDLYAELFKDIYVEAQDDFQTLFGKAFLTAYENEIERFHQESKQ